MRLMSRGHRCDARGQTNATNLAQVCLDDGIGHNSHLDVLGPYVFHINQLGQKVEYQFVLRLFRVGSVGIQRKRTLVGTEVRVKEEQEKHHNLFVDARWRRLHEQHLLSCDLHGLDFLSWACLAVHSGDCIYSFDSTGYWWSRVVWYHPDVGQGFRHLRMLPWVSCRDRIP